MGPASPYDTLAADYDGVYQSASDRAEDKVARTCLRMTLRELAPRPHILDVGCGTGWLPDNLPMSPNLYSGFDLSEGMIERARVKHPLLDFWRADMADDWMLANCCVDLVASTFASPSYDDPRHFLSEAHRVLAPKGQLFLMPWTAARLNSPHRLPTATYDGLRPWSSAVTRSLLKELGFGRLRVWGLQHTRRQSRSPARLMLGGMFGGRPDSHSFLVVEATRR